MTLETISAGMRIGELSARTGVSARSLRYYEEQGLLTSARSVAGQRRYSEGEVDRVLLIQRLLGAGLSSRVIAQLLPCVDTPGAADVVDAAFATMEHERARISDDIDRLVQAREALDQLIAANAEHRRTLDGRSRA